MSVTTMEWRRSRCSWCPGSLVSTLYCISSHLPLCQNRVRVKWWPPPVQQLSPPCDRCARHYLTQWPCLRAADCFHMRTPAVSELHYPSLGELIEGGIFILVLVFERAREREREFASCGLHLPWHAHVHLLDSKFFLVFNIIIMISIWGSSTWEAIPF